MLIVLQIFLGVLATIAITLLVGLILPDSPLVSQGNKFSTPESRAMAERVMRLLSEDPEKWVFTQYNASYNGLVFWIENRPYADLRIGEMGEGLRCGSWSQRRKIRRMMDAVQFDRSNKLMEISL